MRQLDVSVEIRSFAQDRPACWPCLCTANVDCVPGKDKPVVRWGHKTAYLPSGRRTGYRKEIVVEITVFLLRTRDRFTGMIFRGRLRRAPVVVRRRRLRHAILETDGVFLRGIGQ